MYRSCIKYLLEVEPFSNLPCLIWVHRPSYHYYHYSEPYILPHVRANNSIKTRRFLQEQHSTRPGVQDRLLKIALWCVHNLPPQPPHPTTLLPLTWETADMTLYITSAVLVDGYNFRQDDSNYSFVGICCIYI